MASQQALLADLRLSLVGPGKVGSSLAHWAVSHGATLSAVAGRTKNSAKQLTDLLGGRATTAATIASADDDLVLISVGDPALAEVANLLSPRTQARVVLHTSGRTPAAALADLQGNGSAIGSIHPLKAFSRILPDPQVAAGIVFGIDGDGPALELARRLAQTWSGIPVEIPADARNLYHLGATMAAGGVVTLVASASELVQTVGLDPRIARGYLKLAEEAIDQAATAESVADAITGPVARGDLSGFQEQLAELREIDPELAQLLGLLAKRTSDLRE